jgi:hypothetical protein
MSDLFISYSHSDRAWAGRVGQLLNQQLPHLKTFFDATSLRAGDDWEQRIESELRSARHLLVLWSNSARESDWVSREFWTYASLAKPKEDTSRRLVCVNLQDTNHAANAYQQINREPLRLAYPNAESVSDAEWSALVGAIRDALDPTKRPLAVPLVVLGATRSQLEELHAERWQQIETELEIPRAALLQKYGAQRLDWEPFAKADKLTAIFDEVRDRINLALRRHRVMWRLPDEAFWNNRNLDAAQRFVEDEFNTAQLSVLVIDPVAIYHPDIYQRLMLFQDAMASKSTVIVTLPPFGAPPDVLRLRTALINRGMPYFSDYFRRTVPARRKLVAQCGWNVSDREDVERHILAAADHLGAEDDGGKGSPAFLRYG